jgi:predicted kinase
MITMPLRTLMVLCGPAGSGKSTFARRFVERHEEQGIQSTAIVSSDACRALVCDDEAMRDFDASQQAQVQRDAFELFYSIIAKRMNSRRLTIADTLSLHETARRGLLELARRFSYHTCLLVFNMPLQTCLLQNQHQARTHFIPEQMIAYQVQQLQQVLAGIPHEGWDQVVILDEQQRDVEIEVTSV